MFLCKDSKRDAFYLLILCSRLRTQSGKNITFSRDWMLHSDDCCNGLLEFCFLPKDIPSLVDKSSDMCCMGRYPSYTHTKKKKCKSTTHNNKKHTYSGIDFEGKFNFPVIDTSFSGPVLKVTRPFGHKMWFLPGMMALQRWSHLGTFHVSSTLIFTWATICFKMNHVMFFWFLTLKNILFPLRGEVKSATYYY